MNVADEKTFGVLFAARDSRRHHIWNVTTIRPFVREAIFSDNIFFSEIESRLIN